MQINDVIELEIEKLDHQGRGISKSNGYVFFIPNALPGERVIVNIEKIKKNIVNANVEKFITLSKDRVNSICPYFEKCGGCDLLHLSYLNQTLFKENKIKEIMDKFCGCKFKINSIIKCDDNLFYRNKVTFQMDNELGFYEKGTNKVVSIDSCKIVNENVNNLLNVLNDEELINGINQIIVRSNLNNQLLLIVESSNNFNKNKFIKLVSDYVDSIVINNEIILGGGNIIERLGDYKFIISPNSFFQVNTKQTINLYNQIKEYADLNKNDVLLDLYCGTGTIGIYLSKYCKKVIGIEINEIAIKDANKNKEINNINNIDFICGDALKEIKKLNINPDVVVVDPPRAGLDKKDIDNIFKLNANRIVYVSCDPITLARDLNILGNKYNIIELTPVDMFPNTSHVECVCYMIKN